MPYFGPRVVPIMESSNHRPSSETLQNPVSNPSSPKPSERIPVRVKNRRLRYLDLHPDYFSSALELADPLLYDRLIRRFQSIAEREAEGKTKGYSGVLEADLWRSEAKLEALANPDPNATFSYKRGPNGEIFAEEEDEIPRSKQEGYERWKFEMQSRFLRGDDDDFDYAAVDDSEVYDDLAEEDRQRQDVYFADEKPDFVLEPGQSPKGETGVQDY